MQTVLERAAENAERPLPQQPSVAGGQWNHPDRARVASRGPAKIRSGWSVGRAWHATVIGKRPARQLARHWRWNRGHSRLDGEIEADPEPLCEIDRSRVKPSVAEPHQQARATNRIGERVHRGTQAVLHPVLVREVMEPGAFLVQPSIRMRMQAQFVAEASDGLEVRPVAFHGPGRVAIGLRYLRIHSKEPGVSRGRTRSRLDMSTQVVEIALDVLVARPGLLLPATHKTWIWLDVDAQDDRHYTDRDSRGGGPDFESDLFNRARPPLRTKLA